MVVGSSREERDGAFHATWSSIIPGAGKIGTQPKAYGDNFSVNRKGCRFGRKKKTRVRAGKIARVKEKRRYSRRICMLVFVCLISLILCVNKKMREKCRLLPIPSYNSTSTHFRICSIFPI